MVLLTGYSSPDIDRQAQELGCAAVLTKPCTPDDLATVLRRVLSGGVMAENDAARRWTRVLDALRARRAESAPPRRRPPRPARRAPRGIARDGRPPAAGSRRCRSWRLQQLRRGLYAETLNRQHLFDQMPVACLSTDDAGVIQNANQPAAEILNVSARHLRGRLLLHFAADRESFALLLRALPLDDSRLQAVMRIRPRERSLFKLNAVIVPETDARVAVVALVPDAPRPTKRRRSRTPRRSWPDRLSGSPQLRRKAAVEILCGFDGRDPLPFAARAS